MRRNQVTINIERFGDQVPKNYPERTQRIEVYADSNNLYEALAAAFSGVLEEVRKYEDIPSGRCDVCSNALDNPDHIIMDTENGKNFLNGDLRNRERIDPMLSKLEEAWKLCPDLRLGQLIIDCAKKDDVFGIEDDKMIEKIRDFINTLRKD